jgi:hypothetical protein
MDELRRSYSVTITWTGAGRTHDRQWAIDTLNKFTTSPKSQERLWSSPSLLFNGRLGHFPWDKAAGE